MPNPVEKQFPVNNISLPTFQTLPFPKIQLANLNTPIEAAERLSRALGGPEIYIKRDDLTGLGPGGNKARKLEYLVGEAISKGADTLITSGAGQSNHCCQTAAAAVRAGLNCHVILIGEKPDSLLGNRFYNKLFGATEHWIPSRKELEPTVSKLTADLQSDGKTPYIIPIGGSNAIGSLGYVEAMHELHRQMEQSGRNFDYMLFADGSGGTHAGIVVGSKLEGLGIELLPISVAYKARVGMEFRKSILSIAQDLVQKLGKELPLSVDNIKVNFDHIGRGYGAFDKKEQEAITLLARTEGIVVDPVYTGKAMAGLISLIQEKNFRSTDKILFLHTGGSNSIHAHVSRFEEF